MAPVAREKRIGPVHWTRYSITLADTKDFLYIHAHMYLLSLCLFYCQLLLGFLFILLAPVYGAQGARSKNGEYALHGPAAGASAFLEAICLLDALED